jgi:inositol oxygenase
MASAALPSVMPLQRDGQALEHISDQIDALNVRRAAEIEENGMLAPSQFDAGKDKSQFRQIELDAESAAFYKEQHEKQTMEYNIEIREKFRNRAPVYMTVWDAMKKLESFIDNSDPDTGLSQIEHLFQTGEAMRRDGKPRWMQCAGVIHDLGKLSHFYLSQGQWDVVGDTFPVGCAFDERNKSADTFKANPDYNDEFYSSKLGIYKPGCGLDSLIMSWGHDEYLYQVVKDQSTLPPAALAMIRYHSFYPWHFEGAYREFMNDEDRNKLAAVKAFNPYDLYSKSDGVPDVEKLKV